MTKDPGKQHAVAGPSHADDITRSQDLVPGKATRVDDAAHSAGLGNYLSPADRGKLEEKFSNRCVAAGARANDALEAVKIHTLIKKPDDMHWVFGLVLEVAFSGATSWLTRSLTNFKTGKINLYADKAHDATIGGLYAVADKADMRAALFQGISDETIKNRVAMIGGFSKFQARPIMARALADTDDKAEKLTYLGKLQRSLDLAFQTMGETAYVGATDAELNVMFDAMDIIHHSSELYQHAITAKMQRYQESDVERLGKTWEQIEGGGKRDIVGKRDIDRRVVWVTHADGQKTLWFHEISHEELPAGHLHSFNNNRWRLTKPVAREFWEEAVQISEERSGEPVATLPDTPATRAARGVSPTHADRMNAAKLPAKPNAPNAPNAPNFDAGSAGAQRVVRLFGGA